MEERGLKSITYEKLKNNIKGNLNSVSFLAMKKSGEYIYDTMLQMLGKQERLGRISIYNEEELRKQFHSIIDNYDIRCVGELIKFCKEFSIGGVPSWLNKGFNIELGENGWELYEKSIY